MDVYLYQGEWDSKSNVRLIDPTIAKPGGTVLAVPLANVVYIGLAPTLHYGQRIEIPIVNIAYETKYQPILSGVEPRRKRFRINVTDKHISLKFENADIMSGFELKELRLFINPVYDARADIISLNMTDVHSSIKFENADILNFVRILFNVVGEKEPNMIPINVTSSHVSMKFENADELNFADFLIDSRPQW